jgi:hypothetical protein
MSGTIATMLRTDMSVEPTLTRKEFAAIVGLSERELIRKAAKGVLEPLKRGKNNQPFYSEAQAHAFQQQRAERNRILNKPLPGIAKNHRPMTAYTPEEGRAVFALLRKGTSLDLVVEETGMHPLVIRTIAEDFADMTNSVILRPGDLEIINALSLDGTFPIKDSAGVLELLKNCEQEKCIRCKKKPRHVCRSCTVHVVREAQRQAAQESSGL